MVSAQSASAVHKQRTGRPLVVSEAIVKSEGMYEQGPSPIQTFRSNHYIPMHHPAPSPTRDGLTNHLTNNPELADNLANMINISRGHLSSEPIDPQMGMEMSLFIQTAEALPNQRQLEQRLSAERTRTKDLTMQLDSQARLLEQLAKELDARTTRCEQLRKQLAEQSGSQLTSPDFDSSTLSRRNDSTGSGQNMNGMPEKRQHPGQQLSLDLHSFDMTHFLQNPSTKRQKIEQQSTFTDFDPTDMNSPPQCFPTPTASRNSSSSIPESISSPLNNQIPSRKQSSSSLNRMDSYGSQNQSSPDNSEELATTLPAQLLSVSSQGENWLDKYTDDESYYGNLDLFDTSEFNS